jgi:hypothetical protein
MTRRQRLIVDVVGGAAVLFGSFFITLAVIDYRAANRMPSLFGKNPADV